MSSAERPGGVAPRRCAGAIEALIEGICILGPNLRAPAAPAAHTPKREPKREGSALTMPQPQHRDEELSSVAVTVIHLLFIGFLVLGLAVAATCADARGRLQWHAFIYRWKAWYMRGTAAGPLYAKVGSEPGTVARRAGRVSTIGAVPKFGTSSSSTATKNGRRARRAEADLTDDDDSDEGIAEPLTQPTCKAPTRGKNRPGKERPKPGRPSKQSSRSRSKARVVHAAVDDSDEDDD